MHTQQQLMELRRRKPFVPFRITATDGRAIEVNEPLMFGFNEIMILVAKDKGGTMTFRHEDVASIELLEPIH